MISTQSTFPVLDSLIEEATANEQAKAASSELIPVNVEDGKASVNARDLHSFLQVKTRFNDWIRTRIADFDFTQGVDYETTVFSVTGAIDYTLSLDMAKELAMVERNDQGKKARQYFIECEKRLREKRPEITAALRDPSTLRSLLLENVEKVLALENTVSELTPKAAALDRICDAEGLLCITDAAKVLQVKRKELLGYLERAEWIYRRDGDKEWVPYDKRRDQGYMVCKEHIFINPDTKVQTITKRALLTQKGIARLSVIISKSNLSRP